MSTNSTNGTAPAKNNGSKVVALNTENQKAETQKVETPQIQSVANPIEKQRERLQTLEALFSREHKLNDSKLSLQAFKIGSDESSQTLQLRDSKGTNFSTGNPEVIKEIIKLLEATITSKLGEVQSQIIAA